MALYTVMRTRFLSEKMAEMHQASSHPPGDDPDFEASVNDENAPDNNHDGIESENKEDECDQKESPSSKTNSSGKRRESIKLE
ncbi:hypothetical protein AVEN_77996-1 [Araneus ventricosus]|uniref:Uncharacterized protein n=1 Tax=Araneus ventricosus TaxID=182803 RepID=A0A4Y2MHG8_ARAVE|nr:hypothetical protein AVEN_77996-1 [Araneus ventricosus]